LREGVLIDNNNRFYLWYNGREEDAMKIETNQGTIRELQGILDENEDLPRNIRFYRDETECGKDQFGIVVDDLFEDDLVDAYQDLNFIMDAELYEEVGDMIIEFIGNGFFVEPVQKKASKCGSCGGCQH
jgi:hypothetical protein